MYYTRTRCPPCTVLQSRLRREEVAAPFGGEYVFTALWSKLMGREKRANYRDRYDVVGAPTWVVFDSSGGYVYTSIGAFTSDKGGKRLHEAIQSRLNTGMYADRTDTRDCIESGKIN